MKKNLVLFMIISMFTLVLAACGGDDTTSTDTDTDTETTETEELAYEPEDINEETDVCDVCGMVVADNEHAAQILLENDKALKFDDLGCLHEWVEENGEDDIGAQFVRDFSSEEWIQIENSTFVYDEEIQTPMAYGVISFKDAAEAESYVEEADLGEILDVDALAEHEWEKNKKMMDDDDHE